MTGFGMTMDLEMPDGSDVLLWTLRRRIRRSRRRRRGLVGLVIEWTEPGLNIWTAVLI